MKECECEPEHSVAKLGHCRDCPGYRSDQPTLIRDIPTTHGCPPRHADGTDHDFDWATYCDERDSYGVCYCGLRSIDYYLLVMP
jgi:hypothetical protein